MPRTRSAPIRFIPASCRRCAHPAVPPIPPCGRNACVSFRCAGPEKLTRSRTPSCSWLPMSRPTSPDPRSTWMAELSPYRRFRAKPDKQIVDRQAASPSSWKTPFMAAWMASRVEALNYALRGLPQERIRFHLFWGSWHGPHTTDIPMHDIVEVMLSVNAGTYSFEAGNVRHEHEWKVWEDVKLPDGKIILPGVVSHATNVVEHPELVAERILRFANLVGRERVIGSTDCGLGGRVHPDIAWAKLEALAQGAALASRQLWGGRS